MADLEARFETDPSVGWRRPLPPHAPFILGRHPGEGGWETAWDSFISRNHATLTWDGARLQVVRNPRAGNPVFYKGLPADSFTLLGGESFRVGNTVFTLHDEVRPIELTVDPKQIKQFRFEHADHRVEALAELPELIRHSPDDASLEEHVVEALLRGIPYAMAAAVVRLLPESRPEDIHIAVSASTRRGHGSAEVRPSRRLVYDALCRRLSTLHVWGKEGPGGASDSKFSLVEPGSDWALCTPLLDEGSAGYGLYVSGRLPRDLHSQDSVAQDSELKGDLRFTRLTADIFGALRQLHDLQKRQSLLLRFLSPRIVRELMSSSERTLAEVLEARPADVTVLFCDLRGSCRIVEEGSADLMQLWDTVGAALGIMTDKIVEFDGVVGDFQGDAAMGFWGWPVSGDDPVKQAVLAALAIRWHFSRAAIQQADRGLACGIGIAHGPAIAGRLGTMDQFKVSVFGPVVNLASRIEGMTKQFRVPILVDETIGQRIAQARGAGGARVRRVARVRPVGMSSPVLIHELLPPVGPDALPEPRRLNYESAFDAFLAGRWADTRDLLKFMSGDGPSDFLLEFLRRFPAGPPPGWDGVIDLAQK